MMSRCTDDLVPVAKPHPKETHTHIACRYECECEWLFVFICCTPPYVSPGIGFGHPLQPLRISSVDKGWMDVGVLFQKMLLWVVSENRDKHMQWFTLEDHTRFVLKYCTSVETKLDFTFST